MHSSVSPKRIHRQRKVDAEAYALYDQLKGYRKVAAALRIGVATAHARVKRARKLIDLETSTLVHDIKVRQLHEIEHAKADTAKDRLFENPDPPQQLEDETEADYLARVSKWIQDCAKAAEIRAKGHTTLNQLQTRQAKLVGADEPDRLRVESETQKYIGEYAQLVKLAAEEYFDRDKAQGFLEFLGARLQAYGEESNVPMLAEVVPEVIEEGAGA